MSDRPIPYAPQPNPDEPDEPHEPPSAVKNELKLLSTRLAVFWLHDGQTISRSSSSPGLWSFSKSLLQLVQIYS